MTRLPPDPVIDEVREIRRRISARFDHDPVRLVAYYMELQKRHADRLIDRPDEPERGETSPTPADEPAATAPR